MEIVIGIVSSIFTKAAEYTISPIINHVKYLSNHQQNVETLKDQAEKLKDARDRVQHSVGAAQRNGEEIERDVNNWLSAVDRKIPVQVEKVRQDEEKAKKKCFIGLCPNFWTRYKHSLKAAEEAKAVAELLEQGKFDRVSYPVPLQSITVPPVKGYEEFESRTSVLNEIMEALKDDSVSVIGVHGMGGIGKTTLVKEIARKVKDKLFDSVVIATITQTIDIEKIQNRIAELLDLKFEEQSTNVKALRLRERLKKEERVLVVLDDIWGKVDIEEVGIPLGDEHKGCKLLLTSRELNVLSNGMDAQKHFSIRLLNEKEAWDLFKKKAGDCVESYDLKATATKVAKKCAGLPIAIATVAGALRNKRLFEWKNALRELERPSSSNFTGITAAYSAIEWSFNYLESEEVKLTFLLCCVIGHNGLVEKLMRYTVGLGLFGGVNTMEEARNKVLTVVANLKASSLLLDSYNDERFDIHDVVWDAAVAIASRDYHMLVLRDHVPMEWSDKEKMNSWRRISLTCPQIIAELPKELECSGLSFFHMTHDDSVEIPPYFFRRIESLRVLDLRQITSFSYLRESVIHLPESINHLIDLRMLCLRGYPLEDITIIGELKKLEILDLAFSKIRKLPKKIAQLTRLKLLDLSWCTKLKLIPPNVLSSLSKLEELYMGRSFAEWENEGVVGNERRNARLDELNSLPRLTTLHVHIPDVQMIPKYRFIETLDRYRILVGDYTDLEWYSKYEYSRTLKLKIYTNISSNNGVKMLLKKTQDLYLDLNGLEGIKSGLAELNSGEEFSNLEKVDVIIRTKESEPVPHFNKQVFPNLEQLELRLLSDEDQFPPNLFPDLKVLKVNGGFCGAFPIFPFLRKICNLESLDVECFSFRDELPCKGDVGTPSRIKKLKLYYLINLQCMWRKDSELGRILSNLQTLTIDSCHDLINIGASSLSFKNLTTLKVSNCAMMTNLVTPLIVESLVQLTTMEVSNCTKMTEIVAQVGDYHQTVVVGKLKCLKLSYLESLTSFCRGSYTFNFPCLEEVVVESCPKLKIFFDGVLSTPQLQSVKQDSLNMKRCWAGDLNTTIQQLYIKKGDLTISDTFTELIEIWKKNPRAILELQNITKMVFYKCSSLEYIFTPSMLLSLKQLKCIEVKECSIVEQVIREDEEQATPHELKFPLLFSVKVESCSNLTNFYLGSRTLEFPNLSSITIAECPKMTAFSSISRKSEKVIGEQGVGDNTTTLFCDKVVVPSLETMTISQLSNVKMIFHYDLPSDSFQNLRKLSVSGCESMKYLFPASIAKHLLQLEDLSIIKCGVEEIVSEGEGVEEQPVRFEFPKVSSLVVEDLKELKCFYKGHTIVWPMLKTLRTDCSALLMIVGLEDVRLMQERKGNGEVVMLVEEVFPNLEQLRQLQLRDLGGDVDQFPPNLFPHIKVLKGHDGGSPFIFFFLRRFYNLKSLEFDNFDFKHLVHCKGDVGALSPIKNLQLTSSKNLKHIWKKDSELGHILSTLQTLAIKNCDDLINIGASSFSFQNLTTLEVSHCKMMTNLVTPLVFEKLVQLITMRVSDCTKITEILANEGDYYQTIVIGNLKCLQLSNLKSLTSFCPGSYTFNFPCLEEVVVEGCPKLKIFSEGVLSTPQLESVKRWIFDKKGCWAGDLNTTIQKLYIEKVGFNLLIISDTFPELIEIWKKNPRAILEFKSLREMRFYKCSSLKYIFTPSMLLSLEQLWCIEVKECSIIEQVIRGDEKEARTRELKFPQLYSVKMKLCSNLTNFYLGSQTLEFPELSDITIVGCPKMMAFSSSISRKSDKVIGEQGVEDDTTTVFCDKVAIPNLERLTLSSIDIHMIWHRPSSSFLRHLYRLRVEGCHNLKYLFPSFLLKDLVLLRFLQIKDCTMMEQVTLTDGFGAEYQWRNHTIFSKLWSLRLEDLPKLKDTCFENYFEFPCLRYLTLKNCPLLKTFISKSVSGDEPQIHQPTQTNDSAVLNEKVVFPRLEKLRIQNCDSLEEIIELQGLIANESQSTSATRSTMAETVTTKFVFPHITHLGLGKLPRLKSFFSRMHTTQWPSLKQMEVIECPKAQIFGEVQISNQQPLFCVNEDTFPVLQELTLKTSDMMKGICDGQLPLQCFPNLKLLNLQFFPETSTTLPYSFIRSLPNLQKLVINNASISEIVRFEGLINEDRHASACYQLEALRLSQLPELTLKTLEPFLLSFKNLLSMEVSRCHGFINLMACSTAKSLMLLERLSIADCELIEEIISCEGEDLQGSIVFPKLKYLKLSHLPSLASFSLAYHLLEFPVLQMVIVTECPKMKNFCHGELSTPRLEQMHLTRDEDGELQWEGDLNTTIKHMFDEMNVQNSQALRLQISCSKWNKEICWGAYETSSVLFQFKPNG